MLPHVLLYCPLTNHLTAQPTANQQARAFKELLDHCAEGLRFYLGMQEVHWVKFTIVVKLAFWLSVGCSRGSIWIRLSLVIIGNVAVWLVSRCCSWGRGNLSGWGHHCERIMCMSSSVERGRHVGRAYLASDSIVVSSTYKQILMITFTC